ncbi:MAG TPA: aspartate aminotransferase family protein [Gemmatimonadaceae bacterium]|nr:aspartate aminotransferase family protein [Gemmatimonadaceae bacterium]
MAQSHVFYRTLHRRLPVAVRGSGCWIEDAQGRRYLDAAGGAYVVNVGHGVREIADAMAAQAAQLAYVNGTAFTSEPVEALADLIAARSPGDLDRVYFLMSGSEAVEAALKLARQYWVESGRPAKRTILALSPSYHGNTLLALSVSKRGHYQSIFRDWLVPVPRVPAPYSYRCECRGMGAPCPACDGTALEAALIAEGPDSVAAFIAEPIGGSSTGASVPGPEYWRTIRRICDRYDVLLIADEILTGVGRTGTWSAIESYGVVPDLMVLGKGVAGGAAPLSALVAPERIVDVLARGTGALMHAQTFSHHPVSCAAGVATLEYLDAHDLVAQSARMGVVLHEALGELRGLPHIGDVRGKGLLAGVEFVEDTETRRPFPRAARFAEVFLDAAFTAGLIVWPQVGHTEGGDGDMVLLAPPFVISKGDIGEIIDRFRRALAVTVQKVHEVA